MIVYVEISYYVEIKSDYGVVLYSINIVLSLDIMGSKEI